MSHQWTHFTPFFVYIDQFQLSATHGKAIRTLYLSKKLQKFLKSEWLAEVVFSVVVRVCFAHKCTSRYYIVNVYFKPRNLITENHLGTQCCYTKNACSHVTSNWHFIIKLCEKIFALFLDSKLKTVPTEQYWVAKCFIKCFSLFHCCYRNLNFASKSMKDVFDKQTDVHFTC